MSLIHYDACPVCGSSDIQPVLQVPDHSISREVFQVWTCHSCTVRFTQDIPDQAHIGPYYQSEDYISHSNTSKGLINQLYKGVRKFTMGLKTSMVIKATHPQGKVLDIGAGTGAFLAAMKAKGWEITGVEPDEGARAEARKTSQVTLLPAETFDTLPDASFDAITMWHVLEHVHDLQHYIDKISRLLKPEGKLFIAVPNYQSLDASAYGSFWAAYDVPRHLYHFSPASIRTLVSRHGLKVSEERPMWFDSFYISLLSSRYRNGRSNWLGAFFTGLRSNFKALSKKEVASSIIYVVSH